MEWPVSLVLNHKALAQYQMLFRYLNDKVSNTKPRIFSSVLDPDPDWIRIQWGPWISTRIHFRTGSRRTKMAHQIRKKLINFIFSSAGCSVLRAASFSCSFHVLEA